MKAFRGAFNKSTFYNCDRNYLSLNLMGFYYYNFNYLFKLKLNTNWNKHETKH